MNHINNKEKHKFRSFLYGCMAEVNDEPLQLWERRITIGAYEITGPSKYRYRGDYLKDMQEKTFDPKKEEIDDTVVYWWDDLDESWRVDDAWSQNQGSVTWVLLPRRVYLAVRVKKDLGESKYHVTAYCYKVPRDGYATRLMAADFYAKSRSEGLDRAQKIDCDKLFAEEEFGELFEEEEEE
jgi:hypothetical protein